MRMMNDSPARTGRSPSVWSLLAPFSKRDPYSDNVPVCSPAFPFGSHDRDTRQQARTIMLKALRPAQDLGIRTIQLAGYDVYYEPLE